MSETHIETKVKEIARRIFEVDPPELEGRASLIDDLGASSVSRLEFLVELERTFDLQLDVAEIETASTIPEVIQLLAKHVRDPA